MKKYISPEIDFSEVLSKIKFATDIIIISGANDVGAKYVDPEDEKYSDFFE